MRENDSHCLLGDDAVVKWRQDLVRRGSLREDACQAKAVRELQQIADAIEQDAADSGPIAFWRRLIGMPARSRPRGGGEKQGLYLCGGAGRGKSILMDGFYLQLRAERKIRAHFHQFMRHFHRDMKARGGGDPLPEVADGISKKFDIICLDEFHVSDIADAMILGRLLRRLFDNGARMVLTSNYAPKDLYPGGLARDRFLPAIAMLEKNLKVFHFDGEEDYRMSSIRGGGGVFFPAEEGARLQSLFDSLACGIALPPEIKAGGRRISATARASDVIWFSFDQICGEPLGQGDYLELAERFAAVAVSGVPRLDAPENAPAARRFTWLVDILYDSRTTLIMSAHAPLRLLYGSKEGGESGRTLSRLVEMQSPAYWGGTLGANAPQRAGQAADSPQAASVTLP